MDAAPLIDPQCIRLEICGSYYDGLVIYIYLDEDYYYNHDIPPDRHEWRELGECIGRHENLQELEFRGFNSTPENLQALLMGVSHNRSVRNLSFGHFDGDNWSLQILAAFFENNQNLSSLTVWESNPSHEFVRSLSTVFRSCAACSLEEIMWEELPVEDAIASEFIASLAGLSQLKELQLCSSNIGRRGCDAVSALLRNPSCTLQMIELYGNNIGDEGLAALGSGVADAVAVLLRNPSCMLQRIGLYGISIGVEGLAALESAVVVNSTLKVLRFSSIGDIAPAAWISFVNILRSPTCILEELSLGQNIINDDVMVAFADALSGNNTLKQFWFNRDSRISNIGWTAISRALFNKSSIINMYRCNHTLSCIYDPTLPSDVRSYLHLNEDDDKSAVARQKILAHFTEGNFGMEPFNENNTDSKFLPHLLSWIGRVTGRESYTAFFSFLRRAPALCENAASMHSTRKRKAEM